MLRKVNSFISGFQGTDNPPRGNFSPRQLFPTNSNDEQESMNNHDCHTAYYL